MGGSGRPSKLLASPTPDTMLQLVSLALLVPAATQQTEQETAPPAVTSAPVLTHQGTGAIHYDHSEFTRLRATRVASSMNDSSSVTEDFNPVTSVEARHRWRDAFLCAHGAPDRITKIERRVAESEQRVLLEIDQRGKPMEGRAAVSHPSIERGLVFERAEETGPLRPLDPQIPPGQEIPAWVPALTTVPDGAALLPPDAPETLKVGEEWEVAPAELARFLNPSGLTRPAFPAMPGIEDPDLFARYGQLSAAHAAGFEEGEVTARWMGVERAPGDKEYGRIRLAVRLEGVADTTQWMIEQSEPYEMAAIGSGAKDARLEMELEGHANLLWDMEAGRWVEFHLVADVAARFRQDYAFEMRGMKLWGDLDLTFEGETEIEVSAPEFVKGKGPR